MKLYWISVLVGFLVVAWLAWQARAAPAQKEAFTDTTTASAGATSGAASAPSAPSVPSTGPYIEAMSPTAFPAVSDLVIYLTSFSDKVRGGSRDVYSAADARWYNFVDPSVHFQLNSANGVPPTIRSEGVGLRNMTLVGPSSANFRDSQSSVPYELPSFSAVWYAQGLQMTAGAGNMPAMLWQMFGQSPSYMEVYVEGAAPPAPAGATTPATEAFTDGGETYIDIKARIGDRVYKLNTAPVAASTLAASGNPTVYAFTYKKCSNTGCSDGELTFYVGNTAFKAAMSPAPTIPIILANHNVRINSNANIDVRLFAFCYFNTVLAAADVTKLGAYFLAEKNNYNQTMLALQAAQAAAAAAAAGAATASATAGQLEDELAQCRAAADDLKAKLDAGGATATKKPWQIDAGGAANVSTSDMQMCSALEVRTAAARAAAAVAPAAPAAPPAVPSSSNAAAAPPSASSGDWWRIPYLEGMDGVKAVAPDLRAGATATTAAEPRKAPDSLLLGLYRETAAAATATSSNEPPPEEDPIKKFFSGLFA